MPRRASLVAVLVTVWAAGGSGEAGQVGQVPGSDAPRSGTFPASDIRDGQVRRLHRRIEAVAERFRLGLQRAYGEPDAAYDLPEELVSLGREIESLRRHARRVGSNEGSWLGRKVRALAKLHRDLRRIAEGRRASEKIGRDLRDPIGVFPISKGAPVNDLCQQATPLVLGDTVVGDTGQATQDGEASCGAAAFSPDVWFRYDALETGFVNVDTLGSSYDTVLSIHPTCPGPPVPEIACNDDASGLDAAVGFTAVAGRMYWIRLSGVDGSSGAFELHLGQGGRLTGTLRDESSLPLEGGVVDAFSSNGSLHTPFSSGPTGPDGVYRLDLPGFDTYFVRTDVDNYLDEVYDDFPCPLGRCDVASGDIVALPSAGERAGVDFTLARGSAIRGEVEAAAGGGVAGAEIQIFDLQGFLLARGATGSDGAYSVAGLPAGSYRVTARHPGFRDQVFDGVRCGGIEEVCPLSAGTPVDVDGGSVADGVSFVLDEVGSVAGTVTDAATGDPVAGAGVSVQEPSQPLSVSPLPGGDTDELGRYVIEQVPAGPYVLRVSAPGYSRELYDDVPCPRDAPGCLPEDATVVEVEVNTATTGIDFALERRARVAGTVRDAATGAPLEEVEVRLGLGFFLFTDRTDASGQYVIEDLAPRFYTAYTRNELGYVDAAGTPVEARIGETARVDFALDFGGTIRGRVADSSGAPLMAKVRAFRATGGFAGSSLTDVDGSFAVGGLAGSSYFVTAASAGHVGELYDDLLCHGSCDLSSGTPVAVRTGEATEDIDFRLDRTGSIIGSVDFAGPNFGQTPFTVFLYDSSGIELGRDRIHTADASGFFFGGLTAGVYYLKAVHTGSPQSYVSEVYQDLHCPPSCDVMDGTPITLDRGQSVTGIEFAMDIPGIALVTVIDAGSGELLSRPLVTAYAMDGSFLGQTSFTPGGIPSWEDGEFLIHVEKLGYFSEAYDDVPCEERECVFKNGRPVSLRVGEFTEIGVALLPTFADGVAGRVHTDSGEPIVGLQVNLWPANGNLPFAATTGPTGEYFAELPPGEYFAATSNGLGFRDEVFDDLPCIEGCAVGHGTRLVVSPGIIVGNVDFELGLADQPIFSDGFESGDVRAWSGSVGGSL